MFTLSQIQQAHSKIKNGNDFPLYIQELIQLGVIKYEILVKNGLASYFGKNDFEIQSEPIYFNLEVSSICDKIKFQQILKTHQTGQTDYLTFCQQSANSGVKKMGSGHSEYDLYLLRFEQSRNTGRNYSSGLSWKVVP